MRKFIMGLVVGVGITAATQAFGADLLTGEKVSGAVDVFLGNKDIGDGPVINGKSYIPIRSLTENLDMPLTVGKGKVIIGENAASIASKLQVLYQQRVSINNNIDRAERAIANINADIDSIQKKLESPNLRPETKESWQKVLDSDKENLPKKQQELDDYKKQLAQVEIQITYYEEKQQ